MTATAGFRPPASPWVPITKKEGSGAYVSVYLSSSLARLPVRDITRLNDNKSDPNLETGTYGLFSTCEATMRDSIVNRGISEVFFVTTVEGLGRCLVGRYELGWMVEVDKKDIALAASSMQFISPYPVSRITGSAGVEMQRRLRNYRIVSEQIATDLRATVQSERDRTKDYLDEIDRLERFSLHGTGYRYPSWDRTDPFSWSDARLYLSHLPAAQAPNNSSGSGVWVCSACGATIRNAARLKICNVCKRAGTLKAGGVQ